MTEEQVDKVIGELIAQATANAGQVTGLGSAWVHYEPTAPHGQRAGLEIRYDLKAGVLNRTRYYVNGRRMECREWAAIYVVGLLSGRVAELARCDWPLTKPTRVV